MSQLSFKTVAFSMETWCSQVDAAGYLSVEKLAEWGANNPRIEHLVVLGSSHGDPVEHVVGISDQVTQLPQMFLFDKVVLHNHPDPANPSKEDDHASYQDMATAKTNRSFAAVVTRHHLVVFRGTPVVLRLFKATLFASALAVPAVLVPLYYDSLIGCLLTSSLPIAIFYLLGKVHKQNEVIFSWSALLEKFGNGNDSSISKRRARRTTNFRPAQKNQQKENEPGRVPEESSLRSQFATLKQLTSSSPASTPTHASKHAWFELRSQ